MPDATDLFEILHTTRAMRRLKPDPVPDELIREILQAGASAANGGNRPRASRRGGMLAPSSVSE